MTKLLLALAAVFLAAALPVSAVGVPLINLSKDNPPPQIQNAMDDYRDKGADAAWTTLSKGSVQLQNDTATQKKFADYEQQYGKVDRWTHLGTARLGEASLRISYFIVGYETGVAYVEIVTYQSPEGWIATQAAISDQLHDVIPDFMINVQ